MIIHQAMVEPVRGEGRRQTGVPGGARREADGLSSPIEYPTLLFVVCPSTAEGARHMAL